MEFESDAPWTIHMDRVAFWAVSTQPMKVEPGKVQESRHRRLVKIVQPSTDTTVKSRIDSGFARIPKDFLLLVLESFDHVHAPTIRQIQTLSESATHDRFDSLQRGQHGPFPIIQLLEGVNRRLHSMSPSVLQGSHFVPIKYEANRR